jgi:hypothetical protein
MVDDTVKKGELFFPLHPGQVQFSGYGLAMEPGSVGHLVGMLMVEQPQPASPAWLQTLAETYGRCELYPMVKTGERGLVCQMWIGEESLVHVRQLPGSFARSLQEALFPLLLLPPAPQLDVVWDMDARLWRSTFHEPITDGAASPVPRPTAAPRFALGTVVATPGALAALEKARQFPQEFLHRHMTGQWGDLDEHDRQANEQAVQFGGRILSAYSTRLGERLWLITESDRSATTLLTPAEY